MKKIQKHIIILLITLLLMLTGCGKDNTQNQKQGPKIYTQQELETMALEYHYELTGYKPTYVASMVNDDGTVSIQLYDEVDGHNSTCDWYTIDPKTGKGTNIVEEIVDLTIKPKRIANPNENIGQAEKVVFEINNTTEERKYMTINAIDKDKNSVWIYESQEYQVEKKKGQAIETKNLELLGTCDDVVYINENGTIKAFDLLTGEMLWSNSDYNGTNTNFIFDKDGNLYVVCGQKTNLCVIDKDGKTIKNVKDFGVSYCSSVKIKDEILEIICTTPPILSSNQNCNIKINIEDLLNKNNLTLKKEITPDQSIEGFKDIEKFVLDANGTVTIKIKDNTKLSKEYKNLKNSYNACTQVKNIYNIVDQNGKNSVFIMVKLDGTVQYVDSKNVEKEGKITVKEYKEKNIDFVADCKNAVLDHQAIFVDKNGNCSLSK